MDKIFDYIVILVNPFFYLLFLLIFVLYFVKPLFKYLAVNKIIREQKLLHEEYRTHKAEIKEARSASRKEREDKLNQTLATSNKKPDLA